MGENIIISHSSDKLIKAIISKGEDGFYVGECLDITVITQGITFQEAKMNLIEAVKLYYEKEAD